MNEVGQIAKTLVRVFAAACLSTILVTGGAIIGGMNTADWVSVANAGLTAVIAAALVYVDPGDVRYGVKKIEE